MKYLFSLILMTLSIQSMAGEFIFEPRTDLFNAKIDHLTANLNINNTVQNCLVDTGARYTVGKEFILGNLAKVGETEGGGLSNTKLKTDLVSTDLALGDWKIHNAVIARTDRIPFDCLIGNDFFLQKSFAIDFDTHKFSDIQSIEGDTYPLNIYPNASGGHFGFEVIVADDSLKSIFDTGASETVVDKAFVAKHAAQFKLIKELPVTDGNNSQIRAGLYVVSSIKFGHVVLENVEVYVLDLSGLKERIPEIDVVMGLNIIQNYKWHFDTKLKTWKSEAR